MIHSGTTDLQRAEWGDHVLRAPIDVAIAKLSDRLSNAIRVTVLLVTPPTSAGDGNLSGHNGPFTQ